MGRALFGSSQSILPLKSLGIGEQGHLASSFFLGDCSHFPGGVFPGPP